ncbi:MAG: hypothetical protein NTX45_20520 [Proteobacteria bacterium]|nr:hypothetical protein [Pseudomonadota bacterium]
MNCNLSSGRAFEEGQALGGRQGALIRAGVFPPAPPTLHRRVGNQRHWEGQEIKKSRFAISSPTVYIYPANHNNPKNYQKVK